MIQKEGYAKDERRQPRQVVLGDRHVLTPRVKDRKITGESERDQ